MKRYLSILLLTTALTGCSLAPKFEMPQTAESATFKEAAELTETGSWKIGTPTAHVPRGEWWRVFEDAALNTLQTEAADKNLTVQKMVARVQQARATAGIARADYFPDVEGSGSFTRQKPSARMRGMAPGANVPIENTFNTNVVVGYELDLFGRVLNRNRAAKAEAQSAEALLESTRLAMQADVAEIYFNLRALDREKSLLEQSVKLRQDGLNILKKRMEIGTITELDISEAIVDLETTRTQYQGVVQQRKEAEHALAILLGRAPSDFKLKPAPLAKKIPSIPAGLPSALLERRPDITAAQYVLMAENARIGVARAAFFPSISLTGSGGTESDVFSKLFHWSSRTWAIGPLISIPLFSGGEATNTLKRQKAVYEEAVATYRLTVLESFRDVENSLSRLKTLSRQAQAQGVARAASARAEKLANARYETGDTGYLEAITARRNALSAERNVIQLQGARLQETVRLVRVLGGGWDAAAVKAATAPVSPPEGAAPVVPPRPKSGADHGNR